MRKGISWKLDVLSDRGTFPWLKSVVKGYAATGPEQQERDLYDAMEGFIRPGTLFLFVLYG